MNRVAVTVGLTPEEFRRRNFVRQGQTTATGQTIGEPVDMNALLERHPIGLVINGLLAATFLFFFYLRIHQAHFDGLSTSLAIFGLPLFSVLLLNSYISGTKGKIRWKVREYRSWSGSETSLVDSQSVPSGSETSARPHS